MLKKTVFIESNSYLKTKYNQLFIVNHETGEENKVPVEDIGFIILDNPGVTVTQSVIQLLSENNASIIFCDKSHNPSSMLFHLDTNNIQTEKYTAQIKAAKPLKKQLWQQTIKAKIKNQSSMLDIAGLDGTPLRMIAKKVKSDDTSNEEARASRNYWKFLFGKDFRRDRYGLPPKNLLNYGYTILRSATARALAGSGLLPTLGIHHHNKYNDFCLADDIMEPYRPFVDLIVWNLFEKEKIDDITKESKVELLKVISCDVIIGRRKSPLMIALTQTSASLAKCFEGKSKKIDYPVLIE